MFWTTEVSLSFCVSSCDAAANFASSDRADVLQHVIAATHKYEQSAHRDLRSRNDHQLSVLATLNSLDTVDRVCFFRHECGLIARFRAPEHTECYRLSNHCDHKSVFREPHVAASTLTAELLFRCQNGGRIILFPSSLRRYCDMDVSRWRHGLKWQHHVAQKKKYDNMNRYPLTLWVIRLVDLANAPILYA